MLIYSESKMTHLQRNFDFSAVLHKEEGVNTHQQQFNHPFDDNAFEKDVLKEAMTAIKHPEHPLRIQREIKNIHRSFGALVSGEIAQYYGDEGLKPDTIKINLSGVAGQALGAFLIPGVSIYLNGIANDYIGKGMHAVKLLLHLKMKVRHFHQVVILVYMVLQAENFTSQAVWVSVLPFVTPVLLQLLKVQETMLVNI